ncbi:TPA: hypothetical protein BOS_12059 [Bos taurus]|nr:TPA: hypothetical protein BOS_12059 [Bos taurus]
MNSQAITQYCKVPQGFAGGRAQASAELGAVLLGVHGHDKYAVNSTFGLAAQAFGCCPDSSKRKKASASKTVRKHQTEAEAREDLGCSGCALERPAGRFACLRLCSELIGERSPIPRAYWLRGPPLRPPPPSRSGRFLLRLGTGSAPASARAPAAPGPALARLGPAPASERSRRCRLGRSQGHEEAAAAAAARVKVTGQDCGGESGRGSCLERDLLGRFILLAWDYEAQHVFLDFSRQVMSPTEAALKLSVAWRLCTRGMV